MTVELASAPPVDRSRSRPGSHLTELTQHARRPVDHFDQGVPTGQPTGKQLDAHLPGDPPSLVTSKPFTSDSPAGSSERGEVSSALGLMPNDHGGGEPQQPSQQDHDHRKPTDRPQRRRPTVI